MTKSELTALINMVYEAVAESRIGGFQECYEGKQYWNSLALTAFTTSLGALIPRPPVIGDFTAREAPEAWQNNP